MGWLLESPAEFVTTIAARHAAELPSGSGGSQRGRRSAESEGVGRLYRRTRAAHAGRLSSLRPYLGRIAQRGDPRLASVPALRPGLVLDPPAHSRRTG